MTTTGEALVRAIEKRAKGHWQRPGGRDSREETRRRRFTIAISRQRGAGGSRIAQEVGRALNWPVYDRNLVEKIVGDTDTRGQLLDSVDEKHTSWLTECLEAFAGSRRLSSTAYVHRLAKVLVSLAAHGECVIVGRGAGFLLPVETTLRLGLVAPMKQRIARTAEDEKLTLREAERHVKKIDRERKAFVREHFHKDPTEGENYDLIINTARFSQQQCVALITDALAREQAQVESA